MDKIIKNILNKIESEGYEAYLVGGFVRDYLLGIQSCDIDICTNAVPKVLRQIFPNNGNSNNYGGFNLKVQKYNIDITTYRKEITYTGRKPTEIEYINSLLADLSRRDFTINAICMNSKEVVIDPLNAIEDLDNRTIKIIGDAKTKITEDPLRILRAIRFSTILNFSIDDELIKIIKESHSVIKTLSKTRVKEELSKILLSPNCQKGLDLLNTLNLKQDLNLEYDRVLYTPNPLVMWAQIKTIDIPFTKMERSNIINLRDLMQGGIINTETIFKYGLYLNISAGEYLGISSRTITSIYKKMSIHSVHDIVLSTEEIIDILNIKPSKVISDIKDDLVTEILNNHLNNNKSSLKKYLLENKMRWNYE
jgi:tRNA nucleotidyltransferase (CCA-adding enzyme)